MMIVYMGELCKARWLLELRLGLGHLEYSGPHLPWAFTQIAFLGRTPLPGTPNSML